MQGENNVKIFALLFITAILFNAAKRKLFEAK
jgi:hypothetical protein